MHVLYPSIRAASEATKTDHRSILNQCNGNTPGPSRAGWSFEDVTFVPRKDNAGNDEVFRDIAVTSKGLYCAVNRRRATWEEFLPPIIWAHSKRSGSSSRKRTQIEEEDTIEMDHDADRAAATAARSARAQRPRRGRVDDDDDDEAELLSAASVPSWAQSTIQATASRTSPRR